MRARDAKAQLWRQRLADQQASGLTIARWCRDNGCRRQSFYRWQSHLERCDPPPKFEGGFLAMGRASEAPMATFMEVLVGSPPPGPLAPALLGQAPLASEPMRLRLIGGRELLVPMSMPAGSLAQLLHALEASAASGPRWAMGGRS